MTTKAYLIEPNARFRHLSIELGIFTLILFNIVIICILNLQSHNVIAFTINNDSSRQLNLNSPATILYTLQFISAILFIVELIIRIVHWKKKFLQEIVELMDAVGVVAYLTVLVICLSLQCSAIIADALSFLITLRLCRLQRIVLGISSVEKLNVMFTIDFHRREEAFLTERVSQLEHKNANYHLEVEALKSLIHNCISIKSRPDNNLNTINLHKFAHSPGEEDCDDATDQQHIDLSFSDSHDVSNSRMQAIMSLPMDRFTQCQLDSSSHSDDVEMNSCRSSL